MSLEHCCRLCLKSLADIMFVEDSEDSYFSLADDRSLQRMILECFQIQVIIRFFFLSYVLFAIVIHIQLISD